MKSAYLGLAIVGAVVPSLFFLEHFQAAEAGPGTFVEALFANSVSQGFASDLAISSLGFWIWLVRDGARRPWAFIPLNITIGLSCALPAYLYAWEWEGQK